MVPDATPRSFHTPTEGQRGRPACRKFSCSEDVSVHNILRTGGISWSTFPILGPATVGGANDFTIVTPGIRKRIVVVRLTSIETKANRIPEQVDADKCFLGVTVRSALDLVGHTTTILRADLNLCQPWKRSRFAKEILAGNLSPGFPFPDSPRLSDIDRLARIDSIPLSPIC